MAQQSAEEIQCTTIEHHLNNSMFLNNLRKTWLWDLNIRKKNYLCLFIRSCDNVTNGTERSSLQFDLRMTK